MAGMAWNGRAPIRICDSAIEAKGRQTPANQAVKTCLISQILGNSTNPRDWELGRNKPECKLADVCLSAKNGGIHLSLWGTTFPAATGETSGLGLRRV